MLCEFCNREFELSHYDFKYLACPNCIKIALGLLKISRICRDAADRAVINKLKELKQKDRVDCPVHGSEKMVKLGNKRVCSLCDYDPRVENSGGD